MAVEIPLGKSRFVALVDEADAQRVLQHKWWASRSVPKTRGKGQYYARGCVGEDKAEILMHVFIMGKKKGYSIDHIDGNTFNNQRSNLRHCTQSENLRNRINIYSRNTSGTTGVAWDKSKKKWLVRIHVDGKQKHVGRFKNKEEAAKARREAEILHYGEFAPRTPVKTLTVVTTG